MPRKEDIEPPGASKTLKGLADKLALVVDAKAAELIAEAADCKEIDRLMRTLALVVRAALSVQALQAAEDKAEDRARSRAADRAAAAMRAKPITDDSIHLEGDETDMNARDPRLDTPDGVAEIYKSASRRLGDIFRDLEIKRADPNAVDRRCGLGAGPELAGEVPPVPTPA